MASAPFQIRIAPSAEAALRGLAAGRLRVLRNVMDTLAELAATQPPDFPGWLRQHGMSPPLMRFQVAEMDLGYELHLESRAVRLVYLRDRSRVAAPAARWEAV